MLRAILAVIVGYVAMAVAVFGTFTGAYLILGADGSFRPGSYEPSGLWLVVSFVLGFGAALLGGTVCRAIARSHKPVAILAVVVVALGALSAIPMLLASGAEPAVRTGDVGNIEAMQNARTPLWVALSNPIVGAVGVLLAGRARGTQARSG